MLHRKSFLNNFFAVRAVSQPLPANRRTFRSAPFCRPWQPFEDLAKDDNFWLCPPLGPSVWAFWQGSLIYIEEKGQNKPCCSFPSSNFWQLKVSPLFRNYHRSGTSPPTFGELICSGTCNRCTGSGTLINPSTTSLALRLLKVRNRRRHKPLHQRNRIPRRRKTSLCQRRHFSEGIHKGGHPVITFPACRHNTSVVWPLTAASTPVCLLVLILWLQLSLADVVHPVGCSKRPRHHRIWEHAELHWPLTSSEKGLLVSNYPRAASTLLNIAAVCRVLLRMETTVSGRAARYQTRQENSSLLGVHAAFSGGMWFPPLSTEILLSFSTGKECLDTLICMWRNITIHIWEEGHQTLCQIWCFLSFSCNE